ncbi:hypothetical protein WG66_000186 [Moniliophthora roreri]|nr:hypothetical protein WG66_000186 [Moniliophthora roreri]
MYTPKPRLDPSLHYSPTSKRLHSLAIRTPPLDASILSDDYVIRSKLACATVIFNCDSIRVLSRVLEYSRINLDVLVIELNVVGLPLKMLSPRESELGFVPISRHPLAYKLPCPMTTSQNRISEGFVTSEHLPYIVATVQRLFCNVRNRAVLHSAMQVSCDIKSHIAGGIVYPVVIQILLGTHNPERLGGCPTSTRTRISFSRLKTQYRSSNGAIPDSRANVRMHGIQVDYYLLRTFATALESQAIGRKL